MFYWLFEYIYEFFAEIQIFFQNWIILDLAWFSFIYLLEDLVALQTRLKLIFYPFLADILAMALITTPNFKFAKMIVSGVTW